MSFKEDLKVGEKYEEEVREMMEVLLDKKFRRVTKENDPTYFRYFDIIEKTRRKEDLASVATIECKYSAQDSPNVVVEYMAYGKPSGVATSLAKYFVFNTPKFHIIVERADLLCAVINDLTHKEVYRKIKLREFDHKLILIVPIDMIMSQCTSAMKQLRFPVIANAQNGDKSEPKSTKRSAGKRSR